MKFDFSVVTSLIEITNIEQQLRSRRKVLEEEAEKTYDKYISFYFQTRYKSGEFLYAFDKEEDIKLVGDYVINYLRDRPYAAIQYKVVKRQALTAEDNIKLGRLLLEQIKLGNEDALSYVCERML